LFNVPDSHSSGIQRNYHLFDRFYFSAPLWDKYGLKTTVTVSGDFQIDFAKRSLDGLAGFSISGVSGVNPFRRMLFVTKMAFHFAFKHLFHRTGIELLHEGIKLSRMFKLFEKLRSKHLVQDGMIFSFFFLFFHWSTVKGK